ncbi:protein translocase subunit SecD [Chitinimonas lacunae]|uniref:Protein translocase subunit SecD n=1 Tax=Chitinimonas lacunae TaxID=1963018 RepID=A0ABV8MMV0_9NEIS
MNRYPLWKYLIIALLVLLGMFYTLPNLYGQSPAVQISGARSSIVVDPTVTARVEKLLAERKLPLTRSVLENGSLIVRFKDTDSQIKAKEEIQKALGDNYVVALNLVTNVPDWLKKVPGAQPMALGLDLRGGVHFLLEIDMKAAVNKAFDTAAADARRALREKKLAHSGSGAVKRVGDAIEIQLRDPEKLRLARTELERVLPAMQITDSGTNRLRLTFRPEELRRIQTDAVKQNVATLHNRVNELGVAEPTIQQQGAERIVVQLPGVQDTAKAKDIVGRTASLEMRVVEEDPAKLQEAINGNVPPNTELMEDLGPNGQVQPILVRREVELTGDNINDAQQGFDDQGQPAVNIRLDSAGAEIFRVLSKENIGRRVAMILVEKGKGQVVTAPVIRSEIGGGQVQISGAMSSTDARDTALLLRAGALAAPMNIVEERVIGPSLGKENIERGFKATLFGFLAVAVFMMVYYRVFGVISTVALGVNLLFLLSLLSALGVTLTLPGIAAIALTLGMAIDSNVLINERIREEIRAGLPPQTAIKSGYEHAWATILDSNITTLIAGVALLVFGSGAVRGFAWVHCLGILTSMVSAVFVSRAIVNLVYGYRRGLKSLAV